MDENFRKQLTENLIQAGIVKTWSEVQTNTEDFNVDATQTNDEDIGTASDGTLYVKSLLSKYLTENGYPMTQENVDLAAKMFQANGGTYTLKTHATVRRNEMDSVPDENIDEYIQFKIAEQIGLLKKELISQNFMQYQVECVYDNRSGGTNFTELQNVLNTYSRNGWKLKQVFTNEVGKNSLSVSVGGYTSGTNATMDQVVLIFERPAFLNDKTARELYDKNVQK